MSNMKTMTSYGRRFFNQTESESEWSVSIMTQQVLPSTAV